MKMRRTCGGAGGTVAVMGLAAALWAGTPDGARAQATEIAGNRAAVRAELEAYYEDLSARDWEAFADHFWPDATLATVWRPPGEERERVETVTVEEFVERAPQGPGSKEIFEERMTSLEIRRFLPIAQARARYEARFGDPGNVREWEGTDVFTLVRHEQRWRIVSVAYAADD